MRDDLVAGVQTCALPISAARAQSQVVAFVGEAPTTDEDYVQRFDQSRFAEACEAGFVRVLSPDTAMDSVQIGRASCRERGWVSVLPGPLKKKEERAQIGG